MSTPGGLEPGFLLGGGGGRRGRRRVERNSKSKSRKRQAIDAVIHLDFAKVRALVQSGLDVKSHAFVAELAKMLYPEEDLHAQLEMIKLLVDLGAEVDAPLEHDNHRMTAFQIAAAVGNVEAVGLLAERGADVHARACCGQTALMTAAAKGDVDMIDCLVGHGARVDYGTPDGWTPLMMAAQMGHREAVRALVVKHKADTEATAVVEGYQCTALSTALNSQHHDVVELLCDLGAKSYGTANAMSEALSGLPYSVPVMHQTAEDFYGPQGRPKWLTGEEPLPLWMTGGEEMTIGQLMDRKEPPGIWRREEEEQEEEEDTSE